MEGEGVVPLKTKGEKYLVTNYFSTNFTPKMLYDTMYRMLKRLTMYIIMKNHPSFKSLLLYRLKNKKLEEARRANDGNLSASEAAYISNKYSKSSYINPSAFDDVDSMVTSDMLDTHEFMSYHELMFIFMADQEFVNHEILSTCM